MKNRLARSWALPGTKGLEAPNWWFGKRLFKKVALQTDPENHQRMVEIRAAKVARVADFIPKQEIIGDQSEMYWLLAGADLRALIFGSNRIA